jgi:hypothetical protein
MKIRRFIMIVVCVLGIAALPAQDVYTSIFNGNLSSADVARLRSGEILVRNIGRFDRISLKPVNPNATRLLASLKGLKPAYLAEIIRVVPRDKADVFLRGMTSSLENVSAYSDIKYYSERNKVWDTLYQYVTVKTVFPSANGSDISAWGEVYPFTPYGFDVHYERGDESYYYTSLNNSSLKYRGFTCIENGKFLTAVYAFPHENYIIVYGVGGINAPTFPGIKERIETAFINRVITFCTFALTSR